MNIENQNKVMIFRFDGQYGASYSVGLSKKKQDGSYEKGYMPVRFKKGVELENQTEIYITNAWLSFNTKDKKTYPYIFINEFKTLDKAINPEPKQDSFEQFADEVDITEEMLPF